jgi:putative heme-binding domain-containing protein
MLMRTVALAAALLLLFLDGATAQAPPELVASTEAKTPAEEKAGFHLPPGFEAQLVVCEPAINKPMNIAFDDRGRLWVTTTVEYPYPAKPGTKPRDRVVILDDFAPDGHARKVTTFADGLNIPIGVMPLGKGDSALVHSIPAINRLTDTDGDGKADKREEVYTSYGFRDTHGMTNAFTWGFDGWIYACHGFNNESKVKGADGKPIVMQSGNVYRLKADGSTVEYVSHGQVNPFGLCFDPKGNLYSTDCHTRPIYLLLTGAYYPSFGKPDDGLGFGPEMMQHDHGSTGIAGIVSYDADHFPAAYRDSIFIGNVVTSRINRDTLKWTGSSPAAIAEPDFLASDDPWFRPVDIELGPDGALYVADFYNRIIGHYEVPLTHPGRDRERGRIWRIVYTGKDATAKPLRSGYDGTKLDVAGLVADLGDPNLTRRMKAANQLVEKGKDAAGDAVKAATADANPLRRLHALWVLQRLGMMDTATLVRAAKDTDAGVRTHVAKIIGERASRFPKEIELAGNGLTDPDAFVRRASAEALGRNHDPANVHDLVTALQGTPAGDTHLRHAIRIALRDELASEDTWAPTPQTESVIADVAPGIPQPIAAVFLTGYLEKYGDAAPADKVRYIRHIARFATDEYQQHIGQLIEMARDLSTRIAMIKAVQEGEQERGGPLPASVKALAQDTALRALTSDKDGEFGLGIDLVGALKLGEFRRPLIEIIADRTRPQGRREKAVESLVAIDSKAAVPTLAKIVGDASESDAIREKTAALLAAANQPEARDALIKTMPTAPGRLQTAIATGLVQTPAGAIRLLETIKEGKASARLLQERGVEVRLAGLNQSDLKARADALLKGLPPAEERIQTLIRSRRDAFGKRPTDLARGATLFEKNCAACHQLGGKGARIGPQLDGVGVRGVDRILEDVLDPNRNVDQAFRVTSLSLKDGRVVAGLLLREEGEVLVLADAQGKDVRVPKGDVEDRTVSQLSPMPANWSDQIPEAEFPHLLSYLLSQKPKDEPAKP